MALQITSNLKNSYEYTPVSERGEEAPFTVKLRRLSLEVLALTQDSSFNINKDQSYSYRINSQNLTALKHGLIGWKNIIDEDGKPIKFKMDGPIASMESLEYLPIEFRTEIANVILALSNNPSKADLILEGDDVIELEDGE